jgi:hypothetical protein
MEGFLEVQGLYGIIFDSSLASRRNDNTQILHSLFLRICFNDERYFIENHISSPPRGEEKDEGSVFYKFTSW